MERGRDRRACAQAAGSSQVPIRVVIALCLCVCCAACMTDAPTALNAPRASIAFEQIDGPPEVVFRKLVDELAEEAQVRQVAVVSREGAAQFRVRGYLAAHVRGNRTTIAWVWDVYDADQKRALRISGEEEAGRVGDDPWAITDEQMLRRISRASMDRLVAFLAAPPEPARNEEAAFRAATADVLAYDPH
jgi:hypothetical protein